MKFERSTRGALHAHFSHVYADQSVITCMVDRDSHYLVLVFYRPEPLSGRGAPTVMAVIAAGVQPRSSSRANATKPRRLGRTSSVAGALPTLGSLSSCDVDVCARAHCRPSPPAAPVTTDDDASRHAACPGANAAPRRLRQRSPWHHHATDYQPRRAAVPRASSLFTLDPPWPEPPCKLRMRGDEPCKTSRGEPAGWSEKDKGIKRCARAPCR